MKRKKTKKFSISILSTLLLCAVMTVAIYAQVPKKINYQGYLTDASGDPVDGSVSIIFSIYDVSTGGSPLWTESRTVTVNDGRYSVNLGAVNPIDLSEAKPYYLGVKVGTDPEMTPRKELTSSMYSLFVDGITVKDDKVGIGTTDPGTKLEVRSSGDTFTRITSGAGSWAGLEFAGVGNMWKLERDPSGMLRFTEMDVGYPMVIQNGTGNVGIGTIDPSQKLDVAGIIRSSAPQPMLQLWDTNSNSWKFEMKAHANRIQFQKYDPNGVWIPGTELMVITKDGNVGIGTYDPTHKLDVTGIIRSSASQPTLQLWDTSSNSWKFEMKADADRLQFQKYDPNGVWTPGTELMVITKDGNVGIGTYNPTHKLSVNGTIRAKEIVVNTGWSDFVFNDEYKLMTLDKVEQHIKTHRHLPDIPSAQEIEENGVSIGEMQAKLLQKIEELTLYVIDLKKENEAIKRQNEELRKRVSSLEQN